MDYTHYWHQRDSFTESEWDRICTAARKIIVASPCLLALDYDSKGPPRANAFQIVFNGIGQEGHETFVLSRQIQADKLDTEEGPNKGWQFDFCKTAQKPYDAAVCAILAYCDDHFPDKFRVTSDGDANDWRQGLLLLNNFGKDTTLVGLSADGSRYHPVPRSLRP